jgi:hypothetical protein
MNRSVITNISERGIIDYLIRFAFESKSNPRDLWQTVRNAAIDQNGLVWRLLILFNNMRFAVCSGNHGSAEGKFGAHRSTAAGIRTDGESWQE